MKDQVSAHSSQQQTSPPASPGAIVGFVLLLLLMSSVLFISAGTLAWPMGWVYTILTVAISAASRVVVLRRYPDLARERSGRHSPEGVQAWDKKLMPLVSMVGPLVMLVVAGLNYRFNWPPAVPPPLQIVALITTGLCMLGATWAMACNPFFSAVVRIQTDRGHSVVSAGPYHFCRHPAYASSIVVDVAGPLALGSFWALLPGLAMIALTILRTSREDVALQAQLPGYRDYALRVRYRLLPGIW